MRKYKTLKIFSMISVLISVCGGIALAQQGASKSLWIDAQRFTQTPAEGNAVAAYDVMVSKSFTDRENNARFVDPAGASQMQVVNVNNHIEFTFDPVGAAPATMMLRGPGGYRINMNDDGMGGGDARLNNVIVNKLYTTGIDPGMGIDQRGQGKFVYDIAEEIEVLDADDCDVVIISPDKDLAVTRSSKKFDSRVAGVISENPKLVMGEAGDTKPLALAGIVRCNVNTENGPVKKGDILVSSSEPGYAMRASEDEVLPGMIIGSALDALAEGKGKIYILVNQ